jgi:predicted nucleic acid-binding Zn ribbon protein
VSIDDDDDVTWTPAHSGNDEARPVGAALDRALGLLGGVKAATLDHVFAHWDEVVGTQTAAHARPVSLRDGILVVAVDQPAWATQLRLLAGSLLARLSEVAGPDAVRSIEVRVGR